MAIAGAGVISRLHMEALRKMPELQITAICDKDEARAISTAKKCNIPHSYTDFSVMLENQNLSLVSILTPPQSHAELCLQAAAHGVNMVVEKPLAPDTKDARLILDALKRSGVRMTVVYHYLFSRAMTSALNLLETGSLGELIGIDVTLLHTPDDPMASDKDHWCHKIPGGRFGEMLPHPVYLLQAFIGSDLHIESVLVDKRGCRAWLPADELHVFARGKNGIGRIYVSFNASRPSELVDIYCTKRILRIDLTSQTIVALGSRETGKLGSARNNLQVAGQLALATAKNAIRFRGSKIGEYAIQKIYASILDSIDGDVEPLVTPLMAYQTVQLTEEICAWIRRSE